jgi:hypothetical protein
MGGQAAWRQKASRHIVWRTRRRRLMMRPFRVFATARCTLLTTPTGTKWPQTVFRLVPLGDAPAIEGSLIRWRGDTGMALAGADAIRHTDGALLRHEVRVERTRGSVVRSTALA